MQSFHVTRLTVSSTLSRSRFEHDYPLRPFVHETLHVSCECLLVRDCGGAIAMASPDFVDQSRPNHFRYFFEPFSSASYNEIHPPETNFLEFDHQVAR